VYRLSSTKTESSGSKPTSLAIYPVPVIALTSASNARSADIAYISIAIMTRPGGSTADASGRLYWCIKGLTAS
jgi:hypothetical protein